MNDQIPTSGEHQREGRLFFALDDDGDGSVPKADIVRALSSAGLGRADARLTELFADLDAHDGDTLDFAAFLEIIGPAGLLVERALQGGLSVPDFADFANRVEGMFRDVESDASGQVADYIPPLAEVKPDQFGMAVVTIDGQVLRLGLANTDFSIQSTCKPFNYCFALNEREQDPSRDPAEVHAHIGMEPSGRPFNARALMDDGTKRPHNPMINAGAIMSAALVKSGLPKHKRLLYVRDMWSRMAGMRSGELPRFNAWMQMEEHRTGDNNRALGYMMKAAGVLPNRDDATDHQLLDALDLYFSTCSLEMTAIEMATASATLANGGVCPTSQQRVLSQTTVRKCLSLM